VIAVENRHVDPRHPNRGSLSMSRLKPIAATAVLCLMVVVGSVAWAQSEEHDACVDACEQTKAQCVDRCDTHDNPVECDEDCQEAAQDCTRACR
jgi:hypothetical protein